MIRLGTTRLCAGLVIALLSFVVGCSGAERSSAMTTDANKLTAATEQGDFDKMLADADAAWQARGDRAKLEQAIATWEKAAKTASPNLDEAARKEKLAEIYTSLARGYYLLADSHTRLQAEDDELNDQMMGEFEKGVTAAEKAIALRDPKFAAAVAADANNWKTAVKSADPKAAGPLYWYATNMGKWALLEGIATILARKDDIKATMDWMIQQDETYFYGAPHRYFGAYHCKVPIGGGDPPKAKASFEKAIEIGPNYLATRVLMAESYATLVGDRELFETLLNETIAANPDADPSIGPENRLEQAKAKRLLERADDFFY